MKRNGRIGTAATILAGVLACPGLGACAGGGSSGPTRPARISHIVFFKLEDPSQRDALLADCDRLLPAIPGVVSYAAGRHLDVGRNTVDGDYDLGLYIGFETERDYAVYVDHPNHTELVGSWRDRLAWLRVHDVLDESE
tara:strand:+ start:253 stop:669 length:417 start_codon:yes stop_codon:yes gene_type:complete